MNNTIELTALDKKLEALRKLKRIAIRNNDDRLAIYCHGRIMMIKRVRV